VEKSKVTPIFKKEDKSLLSDYRPLSWTSQVFKVLEGITGDVFNKIEDWLNNREQRVFLLGSHSEWIKIKSGVPHGSVLVPLLIFIHINDYR